MTFSLHSHEISWTRYDRPRVRAFDQKSIPRVRSFDQKSIPRVRSFDQKSIPSVQCFCTLWDARVTMTHDQTVCRREHTLFIIQSLLIYLFAIHSSQKSLQRL